MNTVYIYLRGKVTTTISILFCWGAISLAHANADDLVIQIHARPSGICSELIFCLPGHTLSRFSFDRYERYPLKNTIVNKCTDRHLRRISMYMSFSQFRIGILFEVITLYGPLRNDILVWL